MMNQWDGCWYHSFNVFAHIWQLSDSEDGNDARMSDSHEDLSDVDVTDNVNRGWPKAAHYVPPKSGAHAISLKAQPPLLQKVLKAGICQITGDALWETLFPQLGDAYKPCCKVLWACMNECGYEDLVDCFTWDVKFGISMARIHCQLSSADVMHHLQLTQRLSELWGKAKKAASGKPGSYYQLNIIEQPQDRQKSVVELLDQMAYIYPTNVVCVCDSWFFLTNNYFLRVGTWWWTDHISTQPSLLLSRISSLKVHEVHMPKSISIGSCQVSKRVQGRMN